MFIMMSMNKAQLMNKEEIKETEIPSYLLTMIISSENCVVWLLKEKRQKKEDRKMWQNVENC